LVEPTSRQDLRPKARHLSDAAAGTLLVGNCEGLELDDDGDFSDAPPERILVSSL